MTQTADPTLALYTAAVHFDRSDRVRMLMAGPKPAETLTGLVTNDVLALLPGHGHYACALTPKGKIIADLRILACGAPEEPSRVGTLLVDTSAAAGPGFVAMIRKYVNPRLATWRDISADTGCLTVAGHTAAAVVAALTALPVDALPSVPYQHVETVLGGQAVRVIATPELGAIPAYDLWCAGDALPPVREALATAGVPAADASLWNAARVAAGRPAWGVEMDESTLAQEANMDDWQAISYQKGCYTGQETVARVHFRGHVNRTLRQVLVAGSVPVGSELVAAEGAVVGAVRSLVPWQHGQWLGLAMMRREVGVGATVQVAGTDLVAQVDPVLAPGG